MDNIFYIYVLKSQSTGRHYIGQTNNLKRRLDAHNKGLSRYTNKRGPWILIQLKNSIHDPKP